MANRIPAILRALPFRAPVLSRRQSQVGLELVRSLEAVDLIHRRHEAHRRHRSYPSSDGTCTEGRSILQDAELSACASRLSVLVRLAPTPSAGASVAGTTRTSCPCLIAASATLNASQP